MPFVPFASQFPELARQETRSVLNFEEGVQTCAYLFMEMFCDEPGCDCRRVFVQVISDQPGVPQPRATISWGWEPASFYRTWAKFPLDATDLDELRGPALVRLTPQSEEAPELLEQFRVLVKDEAYASRVIRHYAMFRERIELARPADGTSAMPGMNRAERRRLAKESGRRG